MLARPLVRRDPHRVHHVEDLLRAVGHRDREVDEGGVDRVLGGLEQVDGRAVVVVALVLDLGVPSSSSNGELPSKVSLSE